MTACETFIAEESEKTKKAREKLKREISRTNQKITPERLNQKRIEIYQWITRHAHSRVILKDKMISLFDENQNAASLSKKVQAIATQLENYPFSFKKLSDLSLEKCFSKKGSSCSKNPIEIASSYEKYR